MSLAGSQVKGLNIVNIYRTTINLSAGACLEKVSYYVILEGSKQERTKCLMHYVAQGVFFLDSYNLRALS